MYPNRNNKLEILKLYTKDYKSQFYLREISRLSLLPVKNVQNLLHSLEKSRILKSRISGKNKYFHLNLNNISTKFLLLQAEIYKTLLFLESYPVFKTFLKMVSTHAPIIVFGSFAKFAAEKESDLDLLAIQEDDEKLPLYLLPYQIHEIRLSEKSFNKALEKQESLIKEIEANHILLNNQSFYVETMWGMYGK